MGGFTLAFNVIFSSEKTVEGGTNESEKTYVAIYYTLTIRFI